MAQIWSFLLAHSTLLASLGVAVLDLVFALNQNLKANGILHQIYLWLQSLVGGSTPQAPQPPAPQA